MFKDNLQLILNLELGLADSSETYGEVKPTILFRNEA